MNKKRIENEQSFHDKRFSENDSIRLNIKKYYSINQIAEKTYYDIISRHCNNKKLLEYGCGTGDNLEIFSNFNAQVNGIDISNEAIKIAKETIKEKNVNASCYLMNAEKTDFKDENFDIIVGTGIIHHLDLKNIYYETSRLLKKDGCAIFMEPLGHNPLINLYRWLTPNIRTPDEHPLKRKDLKLLGKYFSNIKIEYFSLMTLLAVPFRKMRIFNPLLKILYYLDKIIFKIPIIKEWAWLVVIHAYNPIKNKNNY